jgi:hypothetical protein
MRWLSSWLGRAENFTRKLRRGQGARRQHLRKSMLRFEELEERVLPSLLGQQLFPSDNPWNQNIASAPVATNSAAIISHIGPGINIHPDWGDDSASNGNSPLYGIPFNVVHGNSPSVTKVNVIIDNYPGESDVVAVPMPANPVIEGDFQNGPNTNGGGYNPGQRGDSHLIIWDEDNNIAYEFFGVTRPTDATLFPDTNGDELPHTDGKWHAAQETVWNMNTDTFRSLGYTSADAAGLSILAGLVRPDEGLPIADGGQGAIDHALRFTLPGGDVNPQYIYPASHQVDESQSSTSLPFGGRLRLENTPAVNALIANMGPEAQIIAHAMQQYGLILADIGSPMYVTGTSASENASNVIDFTWNMDDVLGLEALTANDFQVVSLTPVVTGLSATSAASGTTVTINGQNFSGAAGHLSVFFGTTPATGVTFVNDTQITAVVPSGTGTVNVTVQSGVHDIDNYSSNPNANVTEPIFGYGTSATSAADEFTFSNVTVSGANSSDSFATTSVLSGATDQLTIAVEDTTGKPISGLASSAFSFSLAGGASAGTFGTVAQTATAGTYVVTFTGTTAGSASTLTTHINGIALTNTPAITVLTETPPTLSPIGNVSIPHGQTPSAISLNAVNNDGPSGTLSFLAPTLLDPLAALETKFALTPQDGYFNLRGQSEKYLLSGDGSNPAGSGWYLLMPSGGLYAWDGHSLPTTLAQAPVATVPASVYANPALLTGNTGAPIVTSGTNPLYNLKIQFGLVTAPIAADTNMHGANELYLQSSNGSNSAYQGLYVLMPDDKLYAWRGSLAANSLVADLTPYGNVYANPSLLTSAVLPTAVGVTASIAANQLTLTALPGFDRGVQVTVAVSDGIKSTSQAFTFAVTDATPALTPVGPVAVNHGGAVAPVSLTVSDSDPDAASRSFSATVSGYNPLFDLQTQLGLTTPDQSQAFNYRHQNEKYLQSGNGSNASGSNYYVLMPTDKLYAFVADAKNDLTATLAQAPVADFTTTTYSSFGNVYNEPALLFSAAMPASPTVAADRGPLFDLRTQLGLTTPDQAFNYRHQDEKYLVSGNGSNAAGSGYYVLMPNNLLYAFVSDANNDLVATLANAPVANLAPFGPVYAEPSLLYSAQPALIGDPLFNLKQSLGLATADQAQAFNNRHQNEKYLQSSNSSNPAGSGWYVLMPTDKLYAYVADANNDLTGTLAAAPVADFTQAPFAGLGNVYSNPALLYASTGQVTAVTATVNSSGVVTVTPNVAFVGTVRITATVSDGAESSQQSFLFTVNDQPPTLQPIGPVAALSSAGSTTVTFNAATFNGAPVRTAATVAGFNPLFNLKSLLGLTTPDQTQDFNYRHQNEKYLQSSNGSNPAGSGWYVLMPTDKLYAFVPDAINDLTATLAAAPVADFTQAPYAGLGNVYNTPALLDNATLPAAPNIAASFPSLGSLTLTWPTGFKGAFTVTLVVGDGAAETWQSFVVTVS